MYLKTVEDIKKYMLFRPMTPDNSDILFSGSVTTRGKPEEDAKLSADVEHLTCFIGGMVGMSAKIFGLDKDLEIAKRLTDGCVWAYGSTASGIMPEGATVYPCESIQDCKWNQTAYYLFLDPMGSTRDEQVQDYLEGKAMLAAEEAKQLKAAVADTDGSKTQSGSVSDIPTGATGHDYDSTDPSRGSDLLKKEKPISLEKRQDDPKKDLPKPITHNFKDDRPSSKSNGQQIQDKPKEVNSKAEAQAATKESLKQKTDLTEAELEEIASSGRQAEMPLVEHKQPGAPLDEPDEPLPDPFRPLNHTEYVEARIKQGNLPPGFVTLKSRKYILR